MSGRGPLAGVRNLWRRSIGLSLLEQRFWRQIPDRSLGSFYAGVFLTFGSLGFLMDMRALGDRPLPELLVVAGFAASIGVVYAHLGIRRPRWFVVAIPLQFLVTVALRRQFPGQGPLAGEALQQRLHLDLVVATVCITAGYACFMFFIVTVGSEHLRARAEVALARQLHADLVPPLALRASGYALCGRSEPATEVGGDLVDALVVGDEVYALVADVTGHGVRAGTLMGMFKSAARMALRRERELPALLAVLNEVLLPLKSSSLFVTAALLRLHPGGRVEYALAGHPPVLHRAARSGEVRRLAAGGVPVGLLTEQGFPSAEVQLQPGDVLALVTDGLFEVENADGDLGLEGLEAVLRQEAGSAERHLERLLAAARAHGARSDDQSALVVGFLG